MPRTLQEIISHADELADRFENIDPSDGVEQPVAEYLLQRAVRDLAAGSYKHLTPPPSDLEEIPVAADS